MKEHKSRAPAQWRGPLEPGRAGHGSIVGSRRRCGLPPGLDYTRPHRIPEHYGGAAMQEAVLEALRRDAPHPNAVRHALGACA
ncbi:MAG: hypothetical protein IPO19_15260 [Rhodoferax sp.]|nr:hypothetical protein [Rhodoferax sp.]